MGAKEKKDGVELELGAMRLLVRKLEELDDDASRARVLAFAVSKSLGKDAAAPLHALALSLTTGGK
jgi:hypothetical protein